MTGDDILKLAGELFASSRYKSEALCRNIVGRSYYGAYHLALALFTDLGLSRSGNHKDASRWLIESKYPKAQDAGRLLESLYEARRRADYELDRPKAVEESRNLGFVKSQIEMAAEIKLLLEHCSVEPARSQVLSGIHSFQQRVKPRGNS